MCASSRRVVHPSVRPARQNRSTRANAAAIPMHPASGVRRLKLSPQALVDRVTRTGDLFVIAATRGALHRPRAMVCDQRPPGCAQSPARSRAIESALKKSWKSCTSAAATRSNRRCRRAASPIFGGARILRRCVMTLGLMARQGPCGLVVSTTAGSQALLATDTPRTRLGSGAARG